jgi:hypothetical protein
MIGFVIAGLLTGIAILLVALFFISFEQIEKERMLLANGGGD